MTNLDLTKTMEMLTLSELVILAKEHLDKVAAHGATDPITTYHLSLLTEVLVCIQNRSDRFKKLLKPST